MENPLKSKKPRTNKYPPEGVTLEMMLTALVEHYGWDRMSAIIRINCFANEPSIKSSLKFLRKTPWAKNKVVDLYTWRDETGWDPRDDEK